jgi:hypothetical protein
MRLRHLSSSLSLKNLSPFSLRSRFYSFFSSPTYPCSLDEVASPLHVARFCDSLLVNLFGNAGLAPANSQSFELEGPCHQSFALCRSLSKGLELGNDKSLVLPLDLVRLHSCECFLSSLAQWLPQYEDAASLRGRC